MQPNGRGTHISSSARGPAATAASSEAAASDEAASLSEAATSYETASSGEAASFGDAAVSNEAASSGETALTDNALEQASPSFWSSGLCDCFSDVTSCCLVLWCPCVAFGRIAEIVDGGTASCCRSGSLYLLLCSISVAASVLLAPVPCQSILSCINRGKLKAHSNIPASRCEECCMHLWCEPCAMCQEYRELQNQGFDLSLGWGGNKKWWDNDATTMPQLEAAPIAPSMNR